MHQRFLPIVMFLCVAATMGAAERSLVVDKAHSHVEADVKATMDSFTGQLTDYDARITVDPDAGRIVSTTFAFKFAAFATGKAKRDTKMNEWQDTVHHPDVVFHLTKLVPAESGRYQAQGDFTFHGVTHELAFPVTVNTDRKVYAMDGEALIDTRKFGLPVIRVMAFLKVSPIVKVRFHLQGTLAQGTLAP